MVNPYFSIAILGPRKYAVLAYMLAGEPLSIKPELPYCRHEPPSASSRTPNALDCRLHPAFWRDLQRHNRQIMQQSLRVICQTVDVSLARSRETECTITYRFWEKEVVKECRTQVRGDEERVVSGRISLQSTQIFYVTDLQLTSASATGVTCDRTMAVTDLVATAKARPLERKNRGKSSDGTTQIMALKNMA